MSTKHAGLDRKLFTWVRERRTGITVPDALRILKIDGKSERRHVTRRFHQMRARKFITLVSETPVQTFDLCGTLPADPTDMAWVTALPSHASHRIATHFRQLPTVSIEASNSDEFQARGGEIEVLPAFGKCPHKGSNRTGYGFSFDDE